MFPAKPAYISGYSCVCVHRVVHCYWVVDDNCDSVLSF